MESSFRTMSKLRYDRMDKAKIDTMNFYFKDSDWFDKVNYVDGRSKINLEKINKTYGRTGIQPIRCIKCSKPFQKLPVPRPYGTHVHLSVSVFDGIILKKGVCHECK